MKDASVRSVFGSMMPSLIVTLVLPTTLWAFGDLPEPEWWHSGEVLRTWAAKGDDEFLTGEDLKALVDGLYREAETYLPGGAGSALKAFLYGYPAKSLIHGGGHLPYKHGDANDLLGFKGRLGEEGVSFSDLQVILTRFGQRLVEKGYQARTQPFHLRFVATLPDSGLFEVFAAEDPDFPGEVRLRAFDAGGARVWEQDPSVPLDSPGSSNDLSVLVEGDAWSSVGMSQAAQFAFVRRLEFLTQSTLSARAFPWHHWPVASEAITVGLAKRYFDFDLGGDLDGDGIPDWWEVYHWSGTEQDANGVRYSADMAYSIWRSSEFVSEDAFLELLNEVEPNARALPEFCGGRPSIREAYLEEVGGDWHRMAEADADSDGFPDGWERHHAAVGFDPETADADHELPSSHMPNRIELTGLVSRYQTGNYDTPVTTKMGEDGEHVFWAYVSPASQTDYELAASMPEELRPHNPRDHDDDPWLKVVIQHRHPDGRVDQATIRLGSIRDIGHTAPSVGIDRNGYVHVTGGTHHRFNYIPTGGRTQDVWVYYVSKGAWSIVDGFESRVLDGNHEGITYPQFRNDHDEKLYVAYRHRLGNSQDLDVPGGGWFNGTTTGVIAVYDETTQAWKSIGGSDYEPTTYFYQRELVTPEAKSTLFHQPGTEAWDLSVQTGSAEGDVVRVSLDGQATIVLDSLGAMTADALAEAITSEANTMLNRRWDAQVGLVSPSTVTFTARDTTESRPDGFLFEGGSATGTFEITGLDSVVNRRLLYDQAYKLDFDFDATGRMHVTCVLITNGTTPVNHTINVLYAYSDDGGEHFQTLGDTNPVLLPMTVTPSWIDWAGGRLTEANGGIVASMIVPTGTTASYRSSLTLFTRDFLGRQLDGEVIPAVTFHGVTWWWDAEGAEGWRLNHGQWSWVEAGQPGWRPIVGPNPTFDANGNPIPTSIQPGFLVRGELLGFRSIRLDAPCRKWATLTKSPNNGNTTFSANGVNSRVNVGNNFRLDRNALWRNGDLVYQDLDIWATGEAAWGTIYRLPRNLNTRPTIRLVPLAQTQRATQPRSPFRPGPNLQASDDGLQRSVFEVRSDVVLSEALAVRVRFDGATVQEDYGTSIEGFVNGDVATVIIPAGAERTTFSVDVTGTSRAGGLKVLQVQLEDTGYGGNYAVEGPTRWPFPIIDSEFDHWALERFGPESSVSLLDDPDGDQLPNIWEYFLGSDPSVADPLGRERSLDFFKDLIGGRIFLFEVPKVMPSDVNLAVELTALSEDLDWKVVVSRSGDEPWEVWDQSSWFDTSPAETDLIAVPALDSQGAMVRFRLEHLGR